MVETTTMTITIREMIGDDLDIVHTIEKRLFDDPWSKDVFADHLGRDCTACFVATLGDTIIAYLCAVGVGDELHLHNIAVAASYQKMGVGRQLLDIAEKWAIDRGKLCILLDVRESNTTAKGLYLSAGYEEIGRRKNYYQTPGEDAVVMLKILPPNLETLA